MTIGCVYIGRARISYFLHLYLAMVDRVRQGRKHGPPQVLTKASRSPWTSMPQDVDCRKLKTIEVLQSCSVGAFGAVTNWS